MKNLLSNFSLLILLFLSQRSYSQPFALFKEPFDFIGLTTPMTSIADLNGDGTKDLVISGKLNGMSYTHLYFHNQNGIFLLNDENEIRHHTHQLLDMDSDGDIDVLLLDNLGAWYENNGRGKFVKRGLTGIPSFNKLSVALGDIDNDGDLDALIAGDNGGSNDIVGLFRNDGNGMFTKIKDFPSTSDTSMKFFDADGDGDSDLYIAGFKVFEDESTLYFNDGKGNFTLDRRSGIPRVYDASIDAIDVDGDGDIDLAIAGLKFESITSIFLNNGKGKFVEVPNPIAVQNYGKVLFGHINQDTIPDLIVTGKVSTKDSVIVYIGTGNGNFTPKQHEGILPLTNGDILLSDLDDDHFPDILISGSNSSFQSFTNVYLNDGNGNFIGKNKNNFIGIKSGSIETADLNNDMKEDILIYGFTSSNISGMELYLNKGNSDFSLTNYLDTIFTPTGGDIEFSDVDGDNDLDIIMTGENNISGSSAIAFNGGGGKIAKLVYLDERGGREGRIAVGDVDNDKDIDIFICSRHNDLSAQSKLFINKGNGEFEVSGQAFTGLFTGDATFADFDKDGDVDLIYSGFTGKGNSETILMMNDGKGVFQASNSSILNMNSGNIAVYDFDKDNDLDLFLTGKTSSGFALGKMYINNGKAQFTELAGDKFLGLSNGDLDVVDIEGDNDFDILYTGNDQSNQLKTRLYINNGNNDYSSIEIPEISEFSNPILKFFDFDIDGDFDILISGATSNNIYETKIFLNLADEITSTKSYKLPSVPNLNFFPNPASGDKVNIDTPIALTGSIRVSIHDLEGKLVTSKILSSSNLLLDIESIPQGNFIVILHNDTYILKGFLSIIR